ncbi:MAG TPA: acetyl-CoA C-acetyltransferase, partial [Trueperaceae bacterium]|nr:acetyl-CoA C-acetyltransferase [Trueperaceae bacterium]
NASTLNDGAAALVITSEDVAASRGMPVLARIHGWSGAAVAPEWFTVAPVEATRKLFDKLGWTAESVDIFEVNEAFSVVPLAVMEEFGLGAESVNVLGGAVALGHPIGASGARILVTLMNALRLKGKRRGVASICIGGGEGLALGLELA